MPSDTDIAWFAGLLEGEGCFRVQTQDDGDRRPGLRVEVKMCDLDAIERAASMLPTKTQIYERAPAAENHKRQYAKVWYGKDAERVMCMVLPYMCKRRTAKIAECLTTPNLSHHPRKVT